MTTTHIISEQGVPDLSWKKAVQHSIRADQILMRLIDLELEYIAMSNKPTPDWQRSWDQLGKDIQEMEHQHAQRP